MQVTKMIRCDLTAATMPAVDAVQGDRSSRCVACSLYTGYDAYSPPEGVTAAVAYTDPFGVPGWYDRLEDGTPAVTILGNLAAVVLCDAILAAAGTVTAAVVLRDAAGAQLSTFPFRVNVVKAPGITGAGNVPSMGAGFAGRIFYGDAAGNLTPLAIGTGLEVREVDGVPTLVLTGGTVEVPVTVTVAEDGTIIVSEAVTLAEDGTIIVSEAVTLAEDGTILIGGD